MTGFESFKAQDFITALTILAILGVLALVVGYGLLRAEKKFYRYEPIEAIIKKSELVQGPVGDRSSEFRSEGYRWVPSLEYSYDYKGKTYVSDQAGSKHRQLSTYVRENSTLASEPPADLKSLQQHFPAGGKVSAYIYASNPERSYLIREPKGKAHLIVFVIGALFLAISSWVLLIFLKTS